MRKSARGRLDVRLVNPRNWPEIEDSPDPLVVKLQESIALDKQFRISSGEPSGMTFPEVSRADAPKIRAFIIRDDPAPSAPPQKPAMLTPEQRERYAEKRREAKERERIWECHLRWFEALCKNAEQPEFREAEPAFWDWLWALMEFWSEDDHEGEIDSIVADPALLDGLRDRLIGIWDSDL